MTTADEVVSQSHAKCQYCHQDIAEVLIVEDPTQEEPSEGVFFATRDNGLWSHSVCWSLINEPTRIARVIRESRS